MAPGASLARLREHVLDQVARGALTMVAAAAQVGTGRSRLCELRHRYERCGEAGLPPDARPTGRHPRALSPAGRDTIVAWAVEQPTEGPRTAAPRLRLARLWGWVVSHGGVYNVLCQAGLGRSRARLAAAWAPGRRRGRPRHRAGRPGPAGDRGPHTAASARTSPGEQVFFDTKDGIPMSSSADMSGWNLDRTA